MRKKCKYCKEWFVTKSKIKKYCSPDCYHKGSRPKIKQKQYVCKYKANTKCPSCGIWFYKKDADPKVKRNFCEDCLIRFELNQTPLDGNEIYF